MSGPTVKELAQSAGPRVTKLHGLVRRMAISISKQIHAWQVTGVRMLGGDEVFRADLFSGVGRLARPPLTGKPEAIVVMASGGADGAALVGTRDMKTAIAVLREVTGRDYLEPGESLTFTAPAGGAVIHMRADGTTEVRSSTGTAVELATKADVQQLRNELQLHTHTYALPETLAAVQPGITGAGPALTAPTGTTKLKGE